MSEIRTLDCRGLLCPQPVLETKRSLEAHGVPPLRVLVDNPTSKENVARFAANQGMDCEVEESAAGYAILIHSRDVVMSSGGHTPAQTLRAQTGGLALYLSHDRLGNGDPELGAQLVRGFLRTWLDMDELPWRIICINAGVKLTTTDSEAAEALSLLESKGVEVLSCGTCLERFGIADKLQVGRVSNMYEIIDTMRQAVKVISPS